jgi:hypothetical protein
MCLLDLYSSSSTSSSSSLAALVSVCLLLYEHLTPCTKHSTLLLTQALVGLEGWVA